MSSDVDAVRYLAEFTRGCREKDPLASSIVPIGEALFSAVAAARSCDLDRSKVLYGGLMLIVKEALAERKKEHEREIQVTAAASAEHVKRAVMRALNNT